MPERYILKKPNCPTFVQQAIVFINFYNHPTVTGRVRSILIIGGGFHFFLHFLFKWDSRLWVSVNQASKKILAKEFFPNFYVPLSTFQHCMLAQSVPNVSKIRTILTVSFHELSSWATRRPHHYFLPKRTLFNFRAFFCRHPTSRM